MTGLAAVTGTGFSIFLSYVKKNSHLTCRAVNVMMCQLAVLYPVFSIITLIQNYCFVFAWDSSMPVGAGNLFLQLVIWLINSRNLIFLMITIATLGKRFMKDIYLNWSVNIKWTLVMALEAMILIVLQVAVNVTCQDSDTFLQCVPKRLRVALPVGLLTLVAQLCLLGDWMVRHKNKIRKWVVDRWSLANNYVVEYEGENSERSEENRVTISVIQLQNYNQVKQESKEIANTLTLAITFLVTVINYILLLALDQETTRMIRAFINQFIMAATIVMWNISNEQLRKYTIIVVNKIRR